MSKEQFEEFARDKGYELEKGPVLPPGNSRVNFGQDHEAAKKFEVEARAAGFPALCFVTRADPQVFYVALHENTPPPTC